MTNSTNVHEKFLTGLDVVLTQRPEVLRGRVALVTHPAALSVRGQWSADALREHPEIDVRVLMGPEHGVFGHAGAGEPVATATHPSWGLPMYSLYGDQRCPTPEMLQDVDVIAVDLQDLGVRCYTYASTLLLVMEAAAEQGKRVVVLDRPVPLPGTVDGPQRELGFESFVAQIPVPLVYGMTQAETALFLLRNALAVELEVVPMQGYRREPGRPSGAPPWIPPSPGIQSWGTAQCYPVTVGCEALPALDFGAGTPLPFELLGAPWLTPQDVIEAAGDLPGIRLFPHWYFPGAAEASAAPWPGIRIVVSDPVPCEPVRAAVTLLAAVQQVHGTDAVWSAPGTRERFFDQLFGTDQVRRDLQSGKDAASVCAAWRAGLENHRVVREPCLLYAPGGGPTG